MPPVYNQQTDVHFGQTGSPLPDWREFADVPDPDDAELDETPDEVLGILGFDPLEFSDSVKIVRDRPRRF